MLRVSRLADYATVVMTRLAARPSDVLSAVQIAEAASLELPTVSKLLKLLARATLVESFRGANGGYRLARNAERISLAEIIAAVEGPLGLTECDTGQCARESHCSVRPSWQKISATVGSALRAVSLADMLDPGASADPPRTRLQHASRNPMT